MHTLGRYLRTVRRAIVLRRCHLEIHTFSDEHLDGAARCWMTAIVATARLSRCSAIPTTTARAGGPRGRSGVVGVRGGRVVGFLLGLRKDDSRWGPNVWVEAGCHAVEEPEDIRDLYSAAAARWVDEGERASTSWFRRPTAR